MLHFSLLAIFNLIDNSFLLMFLSSLTSLFATVMYLMTFATGIASFIPISEIAAHRGRNAKHTYSNIAQNAKFSMLTVTLLAFMAFITLSNISFSSINLQNSPFSSSCSANCSICLVGSASSPMLSSSFRSVWYASLCAGSIFSCFFIFYIVG